LPVTLQCKGILFDMDGILISSLGSVERSWTRWAEARDIDPEHACRMAHGRRSIETVAMLRPDLDAQAENRLIEQMEIDDTDGITVLPGVPRLLAALPAASWAVVTSATGALAKVRLAAAGITPPQVFISADSVSQGKPNPAPYLAGAALLGFAPQDCVVFEDAAAGARAGRAAGCVVVATTFSHPMASLDAAHYLIEDLTAVEASIAPGGGLALRFVPLAV
jgi:sugar-phosphatase